MTNLGLIGWPAAWLGILYVLIALLSQAFLLVFALPLCYAFYRSVLQVRHAVTVFRMKSVLREYPWQVLRNAPRGIDEHPDAEDGGIWIEFPDPTGSSERGIPLTFVKHHRAYWWLRRIGGPRTKPHLKAQLDTLWFAGDPRFLGVVAVPVASGQGPKRLHFIYRPSVFEERAAGEWAEVDRTDIERARRAGARLPSFAHPSVTDASGQQGTGT
ncbi:hypothetical protein ACPF8X_19385 [Streptomyces sp. G35A]